MPLEKLKARIRKKGRLGRRKERQGDSGAEGKSETRQDGEVIAEKDVPEPRANNEKVTGRNGSLHRKGKANSSTELYDENGKLTQRRYYDENGYVEYDIDFSHGGNHEFPHIHYWN